MNQIQMVCLEDLVAKDHPYRKLKKLLDFKRIIRKLKLEQAGVGATGYGKERLVYCLMLQFMETDVAAEAEEQEMTIKTAALELLISKFPSAKVDGVYN